MRTLIFSLKVTGFARLQRIELGAIGTHASST